jgi:hypothetical protein
MATEIVKQKGDGELFVFAKDPAQMTKAQDAMIAWSERKIETKKAEFRDFEQNLVIAKKNKWRASTLEAAVARAKKKVIFYEKVRDALKAGYYIIPDMEIDLFAIRTTAKNPRNNRTSSRWQPSPKSQVTNSPPTGAGEYVSPDRGHFDEVKHEEVGKDGSKTSITTRWWEGFTDPDFPFHFAKPEILEATAEAMQTKIFDEMGVMPRRRGGDPMVIGRITYREGYNRKSLNFLVSWFLDTADI